MPMPWPGLLNDKYRQAVRIMKITAFIMLVCTLHVSAGSYSQSITLSEKEAPLTKIFKAIEKQTDYIFFYNVDWVKKTEKVNVQVKDMPLHQVLDLLFKDQPVSYSITGKMITVFPKKNDDSQYDNNNKIALPIDIRGKVVDENGKPVPSVTVTVKGTKKQTITNGVGEFSISDVSDNAVLIFSSVNMESFEINVSGQKEILAKLKTKTSQLDEVQVIAYGQTTKRLQTGNVATVKAEDIEKQPVGNPLLALEGRVPGLFITQESGVIGGPVTIRIQGQNSIAKGNDPLIVIDGVPYYSNMPITGNEGALFPSNINGTNPSALAFINPADIDRIDILKDADATSIYGSRAANGAILITTKKGKSGTPKANINIQKGWSQVAHFIELLNTREYLDMRYEAYKNDGIDWTASSFNNKDLTLWDTSHYTNWQKELIGGTAHHTNINASLSGGVPAAQYLVGCTYTKSGTVFPGNFANESAGMHFDLNNSSSGQRLHMDLSGSFLTNRNQLPGIDFTNQAITLAPVAPHLYSTDGTLNWESDASGSSTWTNPLNSVYFQTTDIRTNNLLGNFNLSYHILDRLEIKANVGYSRLQTNDYNAVSIGYFAPENRDYTPSPRAAQYGNRSMKSIITEPQVVYNGRINKGILNGIAGFTFNQQSWEYNLYAGKGYSNDESLRNPQAALSLTSSSGYSLYKYVAGFGRVTYNWEDTYLLNAALRRDGSSRFGDKNKFHNFASVGAAWVFTQSAFLKKNLKWLSFGKLKASYGNTGSDQIGDYSYLSLYNNISVGVPYQTVPSLVSNGLSNPYLQWEETRKAQIGLDLGFLNDRILLSSTLQRNRSSNQLLPYELPVMTGSSAIIQNFPATVQNTSLEFLLNTVNIKSNRFKWNSSFNFTIPKNKLIAFPDIENSSYASSDLVVGKSLGSKKVFHFAGVDRTTGKYQFTDAKGTLVPLPDYFNDRFALVDLSPKFYGGLQNSIEFKGFQLDFLFQFTKQKGVPVFYSATPYVAPGSFSTTSSNQPATVLERWQKNGDQAPIESYTTGYSFGLGYLYLSDAAFKDASFVRLKNVSFSWNLPSQWGKKLHIQNCRLYVQGQNLLTITNYKGLDPENQSITALPPLRTITTGVQLTF
ncbi:hypothetical protein A4H97_29895 [Niastella yeongjuensis]|uniref:Secretin/TonB short N-terminal domain-containing protein n=2 Tax=Niastella yeongjuensis TaxID=354355 RepID=A0A1V9EPM5_9BACT|nr:hypothetical protein A4H97_29895 [Niastella yeongjuensis]